MFDRCFRCGAEGHARAQCPQKKRNPPAPAAPAGRWVKPEPPQQRHAYPVDHYMLHDCPHCGSAAWNQCINVGTRREREPHHARLDLIDSGSVST